MTRTFQRANPFQTKDQTNTIAINHKGIPKKDTNEPRDESINSLSITSL